MKKSKEFIDLLLSKYEYAEEYSYEEKGNFYFFDCETGVTVACFNESGDCFMEDFKIQVKGFYGNWNSVSPEKAWKLFKTFVDGALNIPADKKAEEWSKNHLRGISFDDLEALVEGD